MTGTVLAATIAVGVGVRTGAVLVGLGLAAVLVLTLRQRTDDDAPAEPQDLRPLAAAAAVTALGALVLLAELARSVDALAGARTVVVLAAAVVGGAACVAAGRLFARRPRLWLAGLGVLVGLRIPLTIGGEPANLLLPLYAWIAVGLGAWWWSGPARRLPRYVGYFDGPFLGLVALSALTVALADPVDDGVKQVLFFLVPFSALVWTVRAVAAPLGPARALTPVAGGILGFAALAALVAVVERLTGRIVLNDQLREVNAITGAFRANGLFQDPNILGRFCALAVVLALSVVLARRGGRATPVLYAVGAVSYAGIVVSVSQSAQIALLAGLLVVALVAFGLRRVAAVVAVLAVVGAVALASLPAGRSDLRRAGRAVSTVTSLDRTTSGRYDLIRGGLRIFRAHPVEGVGLGGFGPAYKKLDERPARASRVTLSHTTPITILAELGLIGGLAYLLTLAGWTVGAVRAVRASPDALWPAGAVAALLATLVVHSFAYAAWLEDPTTWTAAALLGLSLPARRDAERAATDGGGGGLSSQGRQTRPTPRSPTPAPPPAATPAGDGQPAGLVRAAPASRPGSGPEPEDAGGTPGPRLAPRR